MTLRNTLRIAEERFMSTALPPLRVSDNGRFLVQESGQPFFYLGDTAWALFHRLTRDEVDLYLENRARKSFTVIQSVILWNNDPHTSPNAYGHKPLVDGDPTQPNEDYFAHVDYVVGQANRHGLYIGLLPTWGSLVTISHLFTPDSALTYGQWLGRRYSQTRNIIWILGGDRPANDDHVKRIWRAMARGLALGQAGSENYSKTLMTFHPPSEDPGGDGPYLGSSSSEWFHNDAWLSFNMRQSGHWKKDEDTYSRIAHDYGLTPVKPTMDGELRYENHPVRWDAANGWFDDYDVRQAVYWTLFAGAHGFTYGANDIWQFWEPDRPQLVTARTLWKDALDLPGSFQMQYVRRLIESRPFLTRVPDQSLINGDPGSGTDHVRATRGDDGSYAMVYLPTGRPVSINLNKMSGSQAVGWWYDPRNGASTVIGKFPTSDVVRFTAPSSGRGNDWVLVLDKVDAGYGEPGK